MATQRKKRANGEGSIRKRKDGTWEGRYSEPETQKQKSVYGKTQGEVRKKLTEIQRSIDLKHYVIPSDTTVTEFVEFYYDNYKKYTVKPQTLSSCRKRYKNIFQDKIGNEKIQKITEEMLYEVVREMVDSGKAHSYIKSACTTMREVFNFAAEKKLIAYNPMAYVKYNMGRDETVKRELSEDELKWFFMGITERYGRHITMFRLMLYSGLRVSELCSLRWENITSDFKFFRVKNNLTRYQDETGKYVQSFCTPKTKGSDRYVPIKEDLQYELREFKEKSKEQFRAFSIPFSDHNLVFIPNINADKEVSYNRNSVQNIINTTITYIKKTYGVTIEHFSPHYFRHKFISVAVRAGMPIRDLMTIVGHSEATTLLKVYAHTENNSMLASVNRLPNMF